MKHILYTHQRNVSLLGAVAHWTRHLLPVTDPSPIGGAPRSRWRSRVLVAVGWVCVLVVQAALILVVREVIQLAHGVIGFYLDLAKLQLDLSSQYVAVTTPK